MIEPHHAAFVRIMESRLSRVVFALQVDSRGPQKFFHHDRTSIFRRPHERGLTSSALRIRVRTPP